MARANSLGQAGSARKDLKPSLASDIRNDSAPSRTRRTVRFISSGSSGASTDYPPPVALKSERNAAQRARAGEAWGVTAGNGQGYVFATPPRQPHSCPRAIREGRPNAGLMLPCYPQALRRTRPRPQSRTRSSPLAGRWQPAGLTEGAGRIRHLTGSPESLRRSGSTSDPSCRPGSTSDPSCRPGSTSDPSCRSGSTSDPSAILNLDKPDRRA